MIVRKLFGSLERTALATVVTTIVIQFNLNIRFLQVALQRQAETDVLDVNASVQPLLFIIRSDRQFFICHAGMIEVICHRLER